MLQPSPLPLRGFQSNRCGVETAGRRVQCRSVLDSNRTVAGLKRCFGGFITVIDTFQSNRCGVEPPPMSQYGGSKEFQSNRCGVETSASMIFSMVSNSNRTVAGLKPVLYRLQGDTALNSNRTVAGLKPSSCRKNSPHVEIPIEPLRG